MAVAGMAAAAGGEVEFAAGFAAGTVIVAATPEGKLATTASEALPLKTSCNRSRMFFRPMPVPVLCTLKPSPSSATVIATPSSTGRARIQTVPDRIFHQRLQHHRRQLCAAQIVGYVDLHGQALAHADLEDFQVGEGAFEFVAQRRLFVLRARQ